MAGASGGTGGWQRNRPAKYMKINDTLDEVEIDLKDEEERLLKMKELIMKEIRVLKAEEVTIQRLIKAHIEPQSEVTPTNSKAAPIFPMGEGSGIEGNEPTITTPLPEINLDISTSRQGDEDCGDEEEEFDSDEDMDCA